MRTSPGRLHKHIAKSDTPTVAVYLCPTHHIPLFMLSVLPVECTGFFVHQYLSRLKGARGCWVGYDYIWQHLRPSAQHGKDQNTSFQHSCVNMLKTPLYTAAVLYILNRRCSHYCSWRDWTVPEVTVDAPLSSHVNSIGLQSLWIFSRTFARNSIPAPRLFIPDACCDKSECDIFFRSLCARGASH